MKTETFIPLAFNTKLALDYAEKAEKEIEKFENSKLSKKERVFSALDCIFYLKVVFYHLEVIREKYSGVLDEETNELLDKTFIKAFRDFENAHNIVKNMVTQL